MKKLISMLLMLAMVISLAVGCAPEAPQPGNNEPAANNEPAQNNTPAESNTPVAEPAPAATNGGGGTLIVRATSDPMNWNPSMLADDGFYAAAQNMFHRLTKLDQSKNAIPDAAESWDVSEDGMVITWHLKQGITWSDGEPLTAEDVKYTFDYIKATSTTYFYSSMAIVDSIEVVDDYTCVFNLNTPDMSFVARIGWYATFIMPEHVFNTGDGVWENNPASTDWSKVVCSGPFIITDYKAGESWTLEPNPYYYEEGFPKLDKIVFSVIPDDATAMQALLNGEIDDNGDNAVPDAFVEQLTNDANFDIYLNEYPSPWRIIFNGANETVQDKALRQAIAYCIDRNDISEKATGNIMPPEWSAYPAIAAWCANMEDIYPDKDIAKAQEILEAAGYTKDADGMYITGITYDAFEGMEDMGKLIIASCKEAGIGIELIVSEYNAWDAKVTKESSEWMIESQGGFMGPDPAQLYSRYGTHESNQYNISMPEFDALCIEAAATGDTAKRAELYRKAQAIMTDECWAINVLAYAGYNVHRADLMNTPADGTGKWGWSEYTYTYFAE